MQPIDPKVEEREASAGLRLKRVTDRRRLAGLLPNSTPRVFPPGIVKCAIDRPRALDHNNPVIEFKPDKIARPSAHCLEASLGSVIRPDFEILLESILLVSIVSATRVAPSGVRPSGAVAGPVAFSQHFPPLTAEASSISRPFWASAIMNRIPRKPACV